MATLWFGAIPGLSPLLGYFPSSVFSLGDDLPRGVAEQWARWGRHPDYLLSEGGAVPFHFARLRLPILAHSIEGDFYAPEAAVNALLGFYSNSVRRHRHLKGPGHFTYFRPKWSALWDDVVDWLRAPNALGSSGSQATPSASR
jgi:predicted alpha/beta hydrolase